MSDVIFPPSSTSAAQIVHLVSGEDVVGVVAYDEARSGYAIRNPLTPQVEVDPKKGAMRLGLLPIRPYYGSDKTKEIFVSSAQVVYVTDLSDQMADAYRQYHSKLVIPKKLDSLTSLLS